MADAGWRQRRDERTRQTVPERVSLDDPSIADAAAPEIELDDFRDQLARVLFWSLYGSLRDGGVDGFEASTIALRAARLAVLRLNDIEQRVAARFLGISPTTAKRDAARIRGVLRDGRAAAAASRSLPPVPLPAGDRVELPPPEFAQLASILSQTRAMMRGRRPA